MFIPTSEAARNALENFIPKAGREYAAFRNYDKKTESDSSVSRLSPWIRNRTLPEWEVVAAVLKEHPVSAASKFIDEVCWRTYWKGWLELRPSVWQNYLEDLSRLNHVHANQSDYLAAIRGETGIDCFDAWNRELLETHYLHNHARMWYASIWIHSLRLPWQLGADWFLRYLLDGDPASNTLSWRWVAGLQTRGKAYLASPDNIRKYTEGRFKVDRPLATRPIDTVEPDPPAPISLEEFAPLPNSKNLGLLVSNEDLSAIDWLGKQTKLVAQAGYFPETAHNLAGVAPSIIEFHKDSMLNCLTSSAPVFLDREYSKILAWAKTKNLDGIVMAKAPVGITATSLDELKKYLEKEGIACYVARHWWDAMLYPQATHGFFRFKKAISSALACIRLGSNTKDAC